MKNNPNFLSFLILSVAIWFGFQYFYVTPLEEHYRQVQTAASKPNIPVHSVAEPVSLKERHEAIAEDRRIPLETPQLKGSIDLKGARIDDVSLLQYRETVDGHAPPVTLLSPSGTASPYNAYYAELSWLTVTENVDVPTQETVWTTLDKQLTPDHPLHLSWHNEKGLVFERTIEVDNDFMFTITDHVTNSGETPVTLFPFGLISRRGDFFLEKRVIDDPSLRKKYSPSSYEGPLGVLDGTLEEYSYKKLLDGGKKTFDSVGGWLGMSDKYWLVAMIPPQNESINAEFLTSKTEDLDNTDQYRFQTDFRGREITLDQGGKTEHTVHLFVGAKHLELLNHYSDQLSIILFNRAIDFGWFWFLTIPFLHLLNYLGRSLGSFGIAILVFTVMIRLITLPLSLKMYHSSARMKELMPEIKRIQERFADDKMRQHQEQAELFKREKINPLSGCMPLFIQLPIFFALYKTLNVSIELRQAPFYGWIHDMSVADPTSLFTLFGLVDWVPPLHIGAWPTLMGLTMWVQQKLSPQPTDQTQARMFMFMPVVLTYIMAQLPVGLVIYYTWSNLLSIAQQWFIMNQDARRRGVKV